MSTSESNNRPQPLNAADELLGPTLRSGRGNDIAIWFRDQRITYNALDAEVNRFGNALRPHLNKGDRMLMLLKDSPDFVAAHLGAMRIGAVAVAISTRAAAQDIAFVIGDSEAKVLVIEEEFLPLYARALEQTDKRPNLVVVRGKPEEGMVSLDDFVAGAGTERQPADTVSTDMAFWLYTSGTTGSPKGAVHCHGDVVVGDTYLEAFGFGPGQRVFSSSKMFFAFALGHVLIGGLRSGSTLCLFEGWPDGDAIVANVVHFRPTIMLSVPAFFRSLLREGAAEHPAFKDVRVYLSAGESLPENLYQRWLEATGRPILDGIGATETIFMTVGGTPQSHKPGATGKPFTEYTDIKLLDADDQPVPPGTPGTLWVRLGSLCRGYWRQPDKTNAAFRNGWFRTGDVFVVDDEGWWYHQGRADDLLKISGQWVSPTEIEECATTVPGISEAIVIGAQDEDGLVRLNMFLVAPSGGGEELRQKVQDKLLSTLSKYKCPRRVVFVDAIPRTATGKARRFRLRNWAAAHFLQRLMRALGLNAATVETAQPPLFHELQRKCVACDFQDRCETDLMQGASAAQFQTYCPNADVLVSLHIGTAH
jgi:benzoate-CoA ligase